MPELIGRWRCWWRRPRDDRGAVATVVAVLLAGGVLLGFLALVVDVGQIYVEREELQSGADAAVLAVARACAINATECATKPAMVTLAQRYANDNSADGVSAVIDVCGNVPGRLDACPAGNGNLSDCVGALPDPGRPFVEVRLATQVPGGLLLPPMFAQTLTGNADYQGSSTAACARATWTPQDEVAVLAVTMSDCDFADATAAGFANPDDPSQALERSIEFVPGHPNCRSTPDSPWQDPGSAAWLAGTDDCQVQLPVSGVISGTLVTIDTPTPAGCEDRLRDAADGREIIYIPVHDAIGAGVPDRPYHNVFLAPFMVTGWQLGNATEPSVQRSWLTDAEFPCGGEALRCISGVFVGPAVPVSGVAAGAAIVNLIG
jgi:Flp pilus assembly protein TadG